jgi:hypothetical protein
LSTDRPAQDRDNFCGDDDDHGDSDDNDDANNDGDDGDEEKYAAQDKCTLTVS